MLSAKRTSANHLNAVTTETALKNSAGQVKNANLEHANVLPPVENVLPKNAKSTNTVIHTNMVVCASKTNVSSKFSMKSLNKWKELVTAISTVLLV